MERMSASDQNFIMSFLKNEISKIFEDILKPVGCKNVGKILVLVISCLRNRLRFPSDSVKFLTLGKCEFLTRERWSVHAPAASHGKDSSGLSVHRDWLVQTHVPLSWLLKSLQEKISLKFCKRSTLWKTSQRISSRTG